MKFNENQKNTLIQDAGWDFLNEFALKHREVNPRKNGSLAEQVIHQWCELRMRRDFMKLGTPQANIFVKKIDFFITKDFLIE